MFRRSYIPKHRITPRLSEIIEREGRYIEAIRIYADRCPIADRLLRIAQDRRQIAQEAVRGSLGQVTPPDNPETSSTP